MEQRSSGNVPPRNLHVQRRRAVTAHLRSGRFTTASVPGLHPHPRPQRMTRKHASRADSGASEESPETGDPAEAGGGAPPGK